MTGPDSWRGRRYGDAVAGARGGNPGERYPEESDDGYRHQGGWGDSGLYGGRGPRRDDHRRPPDRRFYDDPDSPFGYEDDRRQPGQSRLQRREVQRRRQAQRRRRAIVLSILVVAALLAGVDFARGGLLGSSPDVEATGEGRYINAPDPANESSPSGSPSPSRSEKPSVPYSGSGEFATVKGGSDVFGTAGGVLRYQVRIEKDLDQDPEEFAEYVDTTLGDERSWIQGGDLRLQRVSSGGYDFTVYLATPATTDQLCAPLQTSGFTSCRQGDNVVLNFARWVNGVEHWDGDLDLYRRYVINHEVGHRLGHRHELCGGKNTLAPVMQQQTLKLAGCKGNAWPYVDGKLYTGPAGSYGGT